MLPFTPGQLQDFKEIWSRLDLIVDGGTILESRGSRLGSTVVDLSEEGQVKILRDGWYGLVDSLFIVL